MEKFRHKKKDGPNHPFQSNLTYFYEKKLSYFILLQITQQIYVLIQLTSMNDS